MSEIKGWILIFADGSTSALYSDASHARYAAERHEPEPEVIAVRQDPQSGDYIEVDPS